MNLSDLGLPQPLGPFAPLQTLTISKQVYLPDLSAGNAYPLDTYAAFGYVITGVNGIKTSSGTVTAALQINGTPVTFTGGVTSISVTSTAQNVAATSANTVATTNALSLVFSAASTSPIPANIQFTLAATRSS